MGLDIDFSFEVADSERHRVAFHWGQVWGKVQISVDGDLVVRRRYTFRAGWSNTQKYEVTVGQSEVHSVVIEKTKQRLLGGFRKQVCRVFVDGQLVGEY